MKRVFPILIFLFSFAAKANFDSLPQHFSLSYFGYASSQLSENQNNVGNVYSFHTLSLGYRLSPISTLALSPSISHKTGGREETRLAGVGLDYINRRPFPLGAGFQAKTVTSLMLTPVGLGAKLELTRDLTRRWTVGYYPKATFFPQSEKQMTSLEQWLTLSLYFSGQNNITQGLGIKNQNRQSQLVQTLFNWDFNNHMMLSLGMSQEFEDQETWNLYSVSDSAYVLMASIWM